MLPSIVALNSARVETVRPGRRAPAAIDRFQKEDWVPRIYMIHGFIGVGKTTFSKRLEQETNAVRFSPDEWMVELYGENPSAERFKEYFEKIETVIWKIVRRCVSAGADVILDFGFWTRAGRDQCRHFAQEAGADVVMYSLNCPETVLRARVAKRTSEMPEGVLFINSQALDLFKNRFEPVDPTTEPCLVIQTG